MPVVHAPGTTAVHAPPFAAHVGRAASGAGDASEVRDASAEASGDASGRAVSPLEEQAMAVRVEATKRREKKVFMPR